MTKTTLKNALITGAGHGIGLAITKSLSESGWTVIAVDKDESGLREAAALNNVVPVTFDLANDPEPFFEQILSKHQHVHALVNNLSLMSGRSFLELDTDEIESHWRLNVLRPWQLSKLVASDLISANIAGSITFILSLHTHRIRMCPDYSTSKASLAMLVSEMASELARHAIRVNSVSPGAIDTWSTPAPRSKAFLKRGESVVPMGRLGGAEDVANAVAFLVNEDTSSYVTGADIRVDGGLDTYNWLHHLYRDAADERHQTNQ